MTGADRDSPSADAGAGTDTDTDTDSDGDAGTGSDTDVNDGRDGSDAGWPASFQGITESVVTTLGPNDRWNCAALGLHADGDGGDTRESDDTGTRGGENGASATVTARTWGRTRTWRNFRERGAGYVQFVDDPVVFTEAALSIREERGPILDAAAAWVRVDVEVIDAGESGGTQWVEWALSPRESEVRRRVVPTIDRAYGAVIEATVAASRLDVPAYDTDELLDRLSYFESVVERCGGPREREAFSLLVDRVGRRW